MLDVDRRKRIVIEEIISHTWLSFDSHENRIRYPIVDKANYVVPDPAVLHFMTNMYPWTESDVLASIQERKVNAASATYHLLHKRFDSGLRLVGFPGENITKSDQQLMPSNGTDDSHPYNSENRRVHAGLSTPNINPGSYKNYVQSLKENRQRSIANTKQSPSNNIFLQRQKIIATIKPESSVSPRSTTNGSFKEFNLPYTPTYEQLYAWESGTLVKLEDASKLGQGQCENSEHSKENIRSTQEDNNEDINSLLPQNSVPTRACDEISVSDGSVSIRLPPGTPSAMSRVSSTKSVPIAPSYKRYKQANKRFQKRSQSEQKQRNNEPGLSIGLSESSERRETGNTHHNNNNNRRKAKLVKGVTLTLSKAKTIFAFPFSTSKTLTPRGYRPMPSADDLRQAQIVGKGEILVLFCVVSQ